MSTTRLSALTASVAVLGLVVSVVAAWPRQAQTDPTGSLPGPLPGRSASASPASEPTAARAEPAPRRSAGLVDRSANTETQQVPRASALPPEPTEAGAARPVDVEIAAIDYRAPVRPVGVAPSGAMELPADPRVLGWYRFGAGPTEPGSAVLAGHLDSRRFGLGPLVRLRDLEVGESLKVGLSAGGQAEYVVVRVDRFDRDELPGSLFSRTGPRMLRIITCGGEYDADSGGYQSNLVVTAVPA